MLLNRLAISIVFLTGKGFLCPGGFELVELELGLHCGEALSKEARTSVRVVGIRIKGWGCVMARWNRMGGLRCLLVVAVHVTRSFRLTG